MHFQRRNVKCGFQAEHGFLDAETAGDPLSGGDFRRRGEVGYKQQQSAHPDVAYPLVN